MADMHPDSQDTVQVRRERSTKEEYMLMLAMAGFLSFPASG